MIEITGLTARVYEATLPDSAPATTVATPTLAVSGLECSDHHGSEECQYQVAWSINPHMTIGAVDFARARTEHAAFVTALEVAGAAIHHLPFIHAAYDSVFVKDTALLLERRGRKRALLARFRHPERQCERSERARVFAQQGYEVVGDDHGPSWEGGDVVMLPTGDGAFLGHGFRSERAAAAWIERRAGLPVWPLHLRDPHLYHLDMALAILPNGIALVCPWALTSESFRTLENVHGVDRIIPVSRKLALDFGLNLVAVGDTIMIGASDRRISALVRSLGYRTVEVPLGQFHLAGGSAACLVATVHSAPNE